MDIHINDNKAYWKTNFEDEINYKYIEELIKLKQKYELVPQLDLSYNLLEYKKYRKNIDKMLYDYYNGKKIFKFYKPSEVFKNIIENIIKNILNKDFKSYENYINTLIGCDEYSINGLNLGESSGICGCKYLPNDFHKFFFAKTYENIIYSKYPVKYLIYEIL